MMTVVFPWRFRNNVHADVYSPISVAGRGEGRRNEKGGKERQRDGGGGRIRE